MSPPPPAPAFLPSLGDALPRVSGAIPGPRAQRLVDDLAAFECPGLTARRRRREEVSGAAHDPIVWAEARGANVADVDGNVYVDLTAGFGAALVGHAHPAVVEAVRAQAGRMLHALGDVYPSEPKIALEKRLAALAPWPARVILGLSGSDAVEAALKSAALATRRPGVLAFEGAYHGLSYGALGACGYNPSFRKPFVEQLNPWCQFVPWPRVTSPDPGAARRSAEATLAAVDRALAPGDVGAVLVEPILGRGGVETPPAGFLAALAARVHARGALLIADEIYTGLGRTGRLFRSVAQGCTPDVICLGKALGGGLPVSACLVRDDVARAWGDSVGEAIHTSTFLGNPLGCAAALAALDVLLAPETAEAVKTRGAALEGALNAALGDPRLGVPRRTYARLLVGLELDGGVARALAVMRALLERGFVVLPGGARGNVLTLTPPVCVTDGQLQAFAAALAEALRGVPVRA